ncbi:MAG TPA: glycosyltransferase family 9 protein [Bacteroidales bacterium]|nr:glycosyltransferase family 9 protein [Bacteroidales bacterium]
MQKGNKKPHILCLRFSALGDVAIASVVLKTCARDNPEVTFTLAGPGLLAPLLEGLPNLNLFPVDKNQSLFKIFRQLIRLHPTHIADLHSVIRTFVLRTMFFLSGYPVVYLHKGRKSRRRLLKDPVNEPPLIPVYRKYAQTLDKLGFSTPSLKETNTIPLEKGPWKKVGVAPFARHRGKQWPLERMQRIVEHLAVQETTVFLFGGGAQENRILKEWAKDNPRIIVAGDNKEGFSRELEVIRELDVMISMDSANMHFASAVGIPVISIWGATHPKAGFYGWRQDPERAIQRSLDCRPCSIFGAKPCWKGTYECMEKISVEDVIAFLERF